MSNESRVSFPDFLCKFLSRSPKCPSRMYLKFGGGTPRRVKGLFLSHLGTAQVDLEGEDDIWEPLPFWRVTKVTPTHASNGTPLVGVVDTGVVLWLE